MNKSWDDLVFKPVRFPLEESVEVDNRSDEELRGEERVNTEKDNVKNMLVKQLKAEQKFARAVGECVDSSPSVAAIKEKLFAIINEEADQK